MPSKIQLKKYDQRFDAFDANGDGSLQHADYKALAERIVGSGGADPRGTAARRLREGFDRLWEAHVGGLDTNQDGEISRAEFHAGIDRNIVQGGGFESATVPIVRATFDVAAPGGDLDSTAYIRLMNVFGVEAKAAARTFKLADAGSKGRIGATQWTQLWRDFYFSDSAESPGSWLFGDPIG